MAFDFFKKKKKEDEFDDLDNLVLSKMKPGFLVDYDDKTYTVTAKNYYKWEEGGRTDEWELKLGSEAFFLERSEEDGEVEWSLCEKFPISALEGDIAQHIIEREDPPEKVVHDGVTFHFLEDDIGEYFKGDSGKPLQFVAWDSATIPRKKPSVSNNGAKGSLTLPSALKSKSTSLPISCRREGECYPRS